VQDLRIDTTEGVMIVDASLKITVPRGGRPVGSGVTTGGATAQAWDVRVPEGGRARLRVHAIVTATAGDTVAAVGWQDDTRTRLVRIPVRAAAKAHRADRRARAALVTCAYAVTVSHRADTLGSDGLLHDRTRTNPTLHGDRQARGCAAYGQPGHDHRTARDRAVRALTDRTNDRLPDGAYRAAQTGQSGTWEWTVAVQRVDCLLSPSGRATACTRPYVTDSTYTKALVTCDQRVYIGRNLVKQPLALAAEGECRWAVKAATDR
jgi:hypothetical protein